LATTTTRPPVAGNWTPITGNLAGLASECGNVSLLSVRPDQDQLIVSIAQQGLWANAPGSDTWVRLGTKPGSAPITNRGTSILYDPTHPGTFWESGIYNGGAVYRSNDGGLSLRQLGQAATSDSVSVDFTDPARRTMLSGTHEQPRLFRSSDGGSSWQEISSTLPPNSGFASQVLVLDRNTFLLGTFGGDQSGIFRSTNAGRSWTAVHPGAVVGRPMASKSEPGALYWVTYPYGAIVKSTDGGVTWTQVAREGTVNPGAANLIELKDGRLVAAGSSSVIISDDHGTTWRQVGPSLPFAPNGFAYSPQRKAFYVWHQTCDKGQPNPVPADAIMKLPFDEAIQ
jgi:photosystem II stability/assembly factor-like uncharacterized protein